MEESVFISPKVSNVILDRKQTQTLPTLSKAEPPGWISTRNTFVAFVGPQRSLKGREAQVSKDLLTPTPLLGRGRNSAPSIFQQPELVAFIVWDERH